MEGMEAGPTATGSGPTEWNGGSGKEGEEQEGEGGKETRPDGKGGEKSGPTEWETGPAEVGMQKEAMNKRKHIVN